MELEVQKYLRQGKSFENLELEFGIENIKHPEFDIYILSYSQINSPKTHTITRECRSLVIEGKINNYNIVSLCMRRFYNLDEVISIQRHFNWDNYQALFKEDGSLLTIKSSKKYGLLVRTRSSWATSICGISNKTWKDIALECLTDTQLKCIKENNNLTYVFELCSPWNQVVIYHEKPKLVLLTIIDDDTGNEWFIGNTNALAQTYSFNRPKCYNFESIENLYKYVSLMESEKQIAEGFVLTDNKLMRLKIKNPFYLNLHRLNNNGNIANIKVLVDVILKGEEDEVILYFNHLEDKIKEVKGVINKAYKELVQLYYEAQDIKERKAFAIFITKTKRSPFSSLLFKLRDDYGLECDEKYLKEMWVKSKDLIIKELFK